MIHLSNNLINIFVSNGLGDLLADPRADPKKDRVHSDKASFTGMLRDAQQISRKYRPKWLRRFRLSSFLTNLLPAFIRLTIPEKFNKFFQLFPQKSSSKSTGMPMSPKNPEVGRVNYVHINSEAYYWVEEKFKLKSYPDSVHENHRSIEFAFQLSVRHCDEVRRSSLLIGCRFSVIGCGLSVVGHRIQGDISFFGKCKLTSYSLFSNLLFSVLQSPNPFSPNPKTLK